jgi:carbamoylphosphate synthase small subunit
VRGGREHERRRPRARGHRDDPYVVPAAGERRFTIAALDLGIKTATPRHLAALGVETHVLPATATAQDLLEHGPDGVFLSNGPGDPRPPTTRSTAVRGVLDARRPLFGICFGNQILGRALGLGTYKLRFGHRGPEPAGARPGQRHGAGHQPQPRLRRRRAAGPADRHPYGQVEVSHVGLNDDVVEGLRCLDVPAFSVQFHPSPPPARTTPRRCSSGSSTSWRPPARAGRRQPASRRGAQHGRERLMAGDSSRHRVAADGTGGRLTVPRDQTSTTCW